MIVKPVIRGLATPFEGHSVMAGVIGVRVMTLTSGPMAFTSGSGFVTRGSGKGFQTGSGCVGWGRGSTRGRGGMGEPWGHVARRSQRLIESLVGPAHDGLNFELAVKAGANFVNGKIIT